MTTASALRTLHATHSTLNAATTIFDPPLQRSGSDPDARPLHDMVFSIKECYAIAGETIRSGSARMTPIACTRNAEVVDRLLDAGASIVARGNTSEFLLGRETDNLVYGTTQNALRHGHTAGGSSGGDAALVAAGCVDAAMGTDIGGSVRYPAAFNGISSFKPSSGCIPKDGIFPSVDNSFTDSMNSPGILATSFATIQRVYDVVAEKNTTPTSDHFRLFSCPDFVVDIRENAIGEAVQQTHRLLSTKASRSETISIPESGSLYVDFAKLMCSGFTDKIYEWSRTADGHELHYLQELFRRLQGRPTLSDELFRMLLPFNLLKQSAKALQSIIARTQQLRESVYAALGTDGVLILPTLGMSAPKHRAFVSTFNKPGVIKPLTPVSFCNIMNLCTATIPVPVATSQTAVHPPSVQLISAPGNEQLVLNVARELETRLKESRTR